MGIAEPGSREWHQRQIQLYSEQRPAYCEFAEILKRVLGHAAARYAPTSFVQSRAKDLSSFAVKAIRKYRDYGGKKYKDPVSEMTDLCAARIITQSLEEVDRICQYIKATFRVDEANSQDTGKRLMPDQFGYQSVHYVVQLPDEPIEGITRSEIESIGERMGEIQVRTLIQHVWADVGHDRIYKSTFAPPSEWKRDLAGLSALLERADQGFSDLIAKSDAYRLPHGLFLSSEALAQEIDTLTTIHANEPDVSKKSGLALSIARLQAEEGKWDEVEALLKPTIDRSGDDPTSWKSRLLYGMALCGQCLGNPLDPKYPLGQEQISKVAKDDRSERGPLPADPEKVRSRTRALRALGESYLPQIDRDDEALACFQEAYYRDPKDPYGLACYLECEIYSHRQTSFLPVMRPQMEDGMKTCISHARLGIEVPAAYFTAARLALLLAICGRDRAEGEQRIDEALDGYLLGVQVALSSGFWLPKSVFKREEDFLRRAIRDVGQGCPESEHIKRLLHLADRIKFGVSSSTSAGGTALILAGSGDADLSAHRESLRIAMKEFGGMVISWVTNSGVSELAANSVPEPSRLIGYLPSHLPHYVQRNLKYGELRAEDREFSPSQPLKYWEDLVSKGISPKRVRVLGFGGSRIAQFEYKLALALGAKVGLVDLPGQKPLDPAKQPEWNHNGLNILPVDPGGVADRMSLWAFLNDEAMWSMANPLEQTGLPTSENATTPLDQAAEKVHERYVSAALSSANDDRLHPWKKLKEHLKESNRSQVKGAERLLKASGLGLRVHQGPTPITPYTFSRLQVEELAEREHGRWLVERQSLGFRYGPKRDDEAKTHPLLIAWNDPGLSNDVKNYDRDAVRAWPRIFASIGWEIYPLDERGVGKDDSDG